MSNEAFEKWFTELEPHTVFNYDSPVENFAWWGWQAAQADQAEYIAMLELNNKFKDEANQKLREALEVCKYDCQTGEVIGIAKEALGETK